MEYHYNNVILSMDTINILLSMDIHTYMPMDNKKVSVDGNYNKVGKHVVGVR